MKRINNSTWASIKVGMMTTVITAFVVGLALIQQDNSIHFFTLYFTKGVPIALTAGGLAFCITEILMFVRSGERKK